MFCFHCIYAIDLKTILFFTFRVMILILISFLILSIFKVNECNIEKVNKILKNY